MKSRKPQIQRTEVIPTDEATEFFTFLAGKECPITSGQLLAMARYVYEQDKITPSDPRHITRFSKIHRLPKDDLLAWLKKHHGIIADLEIVESWTPKYFTWLKSQPRYDRKDAMFINLLA